MLTRSKFKLLFMKALQNEISECELETLNKWLNKSPANKAEFDRMKNLWNDMGSVPVNPPKVDVKKEWESVEKKINAPHRNKYNEWVFTAKFRSLFTSQTHLYLRPAFAIGAVIILIASIFIIYQNSLKKEIHYQTFTAANKQKVNVQLSDGSSIKLNSGTSVTVQDKFSDDKREVSLNGEAYFDVAKEKRPCIITTDNAKIEVLGTSFNVWARDNQTRVIVKEGVVRLSSLKSQNDFVLIQADQMSRVVKDASPFEAKKIESARLIGWPDGKLVFEHCPLSEFINEIERQYNIKIDIQRQNEKNLELTGTFDNLSIDQVISSVCITFNLEYYQINQNKYVIR